MSEDSSERSRQLEDYHDLGYLDKPTCPQCDRELGTAPGPGGIAFKCVRHGKFHSVEVPANPLDVMKRDMDNSGPGLGAILVVAPLAFALAAANRATELVFGD